MKAKEYVQSENMNLLMEIVDLKNKQSKLYKQKGPTSSDYISLSIKLNILTHEYFEEKISNLGKVSALE